MAKKVIDVIGNEMANTPTPSGASDIEGAKYADGSYDMDLVIGGDFGLGGPEGILINDIGRG